MVHFCIQNIFEFECSEKIFFPIHKRENHFDVIDTHTIISPTTVYQVDIWQKQHYQER